MDLHFITFKKIHPSIFFIEPQISKINMGLLYFFRFFYKIIFNFIFQYLIFVGLVFMFFFHFLSIGLFKFYVHGHLINRLTRVDLNFFIALKKINSMPHDFFY
jgi:hypothetical protein